MLMPLEAEGRTGFGRLKSRFQESGVSYRG
jgi:hypothetical protein